MAYEMRISDWSSDVCSSDLSGDSRTLLHGIDQSGRLIADVEGITLIRSQGRTYLLVSSQGDSAFAVWRVDGAPAYVGRCQVGAHRDEIGRASCRERGCPYV